MAITVERQVLTIPELARVLGMRPEYIRRELIHGNRIRHVRMGPKMIRIPLDAVQEFLKATGPAEVPIKREGAQPK